GRSRHVDLSCPPSWRSRGRTPRRRRTPAWVSALYKLLSSTYETNKRDAVATRTALEKFQPTATLAKKFAPAWGSIENSAFLGLDRVLAQDLEKIGVDHPAPSEFANEVLIHVLGLKGDSAMQTVRKSVTRSRKRQETPD